MFKPLKNICLIGLVGWLASIAIPAQAALISFNFSGTVESGLLLGESYNGQVSFDNSSLTNTGAESVGLTSLTVSFLSTTYGLADGAPPVTADFMDGVFLGVSYVVTSSIGLAFSFISAAGTGLPDDQPYFAYDTLVGDSGLGSLVYFVDEPVGLALFGIGLAFMTFLGRNRKS